MKNNNNESKLLIDQLAQNTVEILGLYWTQVETLALGTDELKVAIIHSIKPSPKGGFTAKSTLGFGKRIKATVEHTIDANQIEMPFDEKPAKAAPARKRKALEAAASET